MPTDPLSPPSGRRDDARAMAVVCHGDSEPTGNDTPGTWTMQALCQTPHDTDNTTRDANVVTSAGVLRVFVSPNPRRPPPPSPHVYRRP